MEAHAATTTLNSLPDELLLAIAEHLDRPARYSLIRASQRLFRVVLPLVYSRRVKLSQRNIPAELVSGASPRLPFYLHAIRKAWLVFSAEDELAVLQNNGADDRVLAFLELFGHNLISLVVMQRLPLGCVPWFEDHDMGDELPESFESSVHLPLRIALALQRCVKVASLDFVGLKFTAATLLIPFLPSARFKHQTGLGSVAGIRELGFERCTFADDILPHHLALFTERLGQLGPSNSDSPSPSRRPRFEEMPSLKDLSIKEPREFSPSRVTFDVLGHSIRELARFEPRPSTPLPEPTNGTIIDYNQQLPSWESNPDPLYSIKRAVKTSTVPLERVYMSHRPMWAPQTPLNNPPKQFRSLALIRNIGLDMNKVICMVQGGWCSHLDELIVLNLAADDEDLQCLGKVCPFLTRLDIGLDEGCGPLGVKSLIDGCHNLVELYLDNVRSEFIVDLPESAVLELTNAPHLEFLWLPECVVTVRVGEALAAMPCLRDLKLSGWPSEIDPEGVFALTRSKTLAKLEISVYAVEELAPGGSHGVQLLLAAWTMLKNAMKREAPNLSIEFVLMALSDATRWETHVVP